MEWRDTVHYEQYSGVMRSMMISKHVQIKAGCQAWQVSYTTQRLIEDCGLESVGSKTENVVVRAQTLLILIA